MAWYVFRCRQCGEEFGALSTWSRKSEVVCPKCGSNWLEEQFHHYRTNSAGGSSTGPSGSCGSTSFG
jgi:putative FmdB family regulatory protein